MAFIQSCFIRKNTPELRNFIYVDLVTELMHFYHKHHLDYRGLIPKGLALDANGLNIY